MPKFQRLLLRVMLWSLAVATVIGVVAIVTGVYETSMRVAGTVLFTAIAAGIVVRVCRLLNRPASRAAGLVGVATILVEYFIAVAVIWTPDQYSEYLWSLLYLIAVAGVLTMVSLRVRWMKGGKLGGTIGASAGAAAIVLGVIFGPFSYHSFFEAILFSEIEPMEWAIRHVRSIEWMVLVSGLFAGAALVRPDDQPIAYWRWAGVAASLLAMVTWLVFPLYSDSGAYWTITLYEAALMAAFVIAYASCTLLIPLTPGQSVLRAAAIIFATAIAFSRLVPDITEGGRFDPFEEETWTTRIQLAAGLVTGCATMAMLVLMRLNTKARKTDTLDKAPTSLWLQCPRCHREQTVTLGDAECPGCRLRIFAQIEEPTCAKCGYLLYGLAGNTCPECGEPIAQEPAAAPAV